MRLRNLLICLSLFTVIYAVGCSGSAAVPGPEEPRQVTALTPGMVQLAVQASPDGAALSVDGQLRGASPLTITLSSGDHQIALSANGYAPLTETITLTPGKEAIYSPALTDNTPPVVTLTADQVQVPWLGQAEVHATAIDNAGVVELELMSGDDQVAAAQEGQLDYTLVPAEASGAAPGSSYTVTARAKDAAGNLGEASLTFQIGPLPQQGTPGPTFQATAQPQRATASAQPVIGTPTPGKAPANVPAASPTRRSPSQPTVVPTPGTPTTLRVEEITIPTYPYAPYVSPVVDPSLGDYPVLALDRSAYEASQSQPIPKKYKLVVLDNRYLRLSFLPELGGRLYEVIFKPTGNNEFYRNPVIKPTQWGPPSPPHPARSNWWLAAGGMEWGFPVEEHGYEWATQWGYDFVNLPDGGIMVSLFTRDPQRPYVVVDVTLPPDAAYFTVQPRITNAWGSPFRFKWWSDALLAPGAANKPGPELRFIFPGDQMTIHSTGDPTMPGPGQPFSWPVYNGRDMSRLGNWDQYLGFFQRPAAQGNFMGVYDAAADEGMARVYPSDVARGAKGFAMGWSDALDPSAWTDDGSGYVELQGGLTPTYDEWYELPPGGEITWRETWYPVAGIGGMTYAAEGGAINLAPTSGGLRIGIFPTTAVQGRLSVSLPGIEPVLREVQISPAKPFSQEIPYIEPVPDQGEVIVTLTDAEGQAVLSYRGQVASR